MAYCPRCGTENDPSSTHCPLCATPLPRLDDAGPGEPAWPPAGDNLSRVFATPGQRRRRVFAGLSVALLFPVILVTGVNLLVDRSVTWSWIPDLALVGVFSLVAAGFGLHRRPGLLLTAWTGLTALILLAADLLAQGGGWWWKLGLPVAALGYGLVALLAGWLRRGPAPGWNLFGHLALGTATFCAALEFLVRTTFATAEGLWWSGVVALILVPLGVLFHALQRFSRPVNLRQTFHL